MMPGSKSAARWAGAPLLPVSAAVHVGAAAGLALAPGAWGWAVGALVVNHAVLTATGLWPRSHWLGPNWTRLPQAAAGKVAITIDDGPHPDVTPRVLDLLGEHAAQATFFCIGERVERHADLAREIIARGHAIENHSQRHRHDFSLLGPSRMYAEIASAQASITRVTGIAPRFFRAPAGLRNPFLNAVLMRQKLQLASWTRRGFDTVNGDPDAIFHRLADRLQERDILLLHDGNAARSPGGRAVVLEVLPRLLAAVRARGLQPITLGSAKPVAQAP